jgi:general stress protein 26
MEFLVVFGHAEISSDQHIIERYYSSSDDAWFEGVDDPNVTAIKVIPKDVHYWNTKNGMIKSLLKMAAGAVTGKQQDLGEEGKLSIAKN